MTERILVVDDEQDLEYLIRQKFRKKIKEREYDFVFATNGEEALERIQDDRDIQIMLTDINMPRMDGLTLLSKLSELDLPVMSVIVSAYGDMSNIRAAMNRGAFDFLIKPIDFDDLEVTINKTRDMARKLKKAHEQEQDIKAAWQIQKRIIPANPPQINRTQIAARYVPMAGVGGDFYDFHVLDKDNLGVLIADVSGHGVPAALIASMVKIAFALQDEHAKDTKIVLERINDVLRGRIQENFVTACYALIDTKNRRLIVSRAAHPSLLVWRKQTGELIPLGPRGKLLGWFPCLDCQIEEMDILPGDRIIMYTDGIIEAFNPDGQMFGDEGFERVIRENSDKSPQEFVDALYSALTGWCQGGGENGKPVSFEDDVTIVITDIME